MVKRRAVIVGLAALLPAEAFARGMYCTRHRDRCEERRERWEKMTDEQRAAENAQVNAFLDDAEAKRNRALFTGLGIIGGIGTVLGVAMWAAFARPLKR
jgi:hypothetical protein